MGSVLRHSRMIAPLGLAVVATAGTVAEDFATLKSRRDEAIARAIAPAEARYRDELAVVKARAMRDGDLDGAVRINAAIDAIGSDRTRVDPAKLAGALRLALPGTEWMWGSFAFRFEADGRIWVSSRQLWFMHKWELVEGTDLVLRTDLGSLYYHFNDGAFVQDRKKSSWKEGKPIRFKGVAAPVPAPSGGE